MTMEDAVGMGVAEGLPPVVSHVLLLWGVILTLAAVTLAALLVGAPLARGKGGREGSGAATVAAFVMVLAALSAYGVLGEPSIPSAPYEETRRVLRAAFSSPEAPHALEDVAALEARAARLDARLRAKRDDVEGWGELASVYLRLGHIGAARQACRHGLSLGRSEGAWLRPCALALTLSGDAAAGEVFERLAAVGDVAILWRAGLLAARAGYAREAVVVWERLLAYLEEGEVVEGEEEEAQMVRLFLRRAIAALRGEAGGG